MKKLSLSLIILLIFACGKNTDPAFQKLIQTKPYTVLMFIAPDCPLCTALSTPYSQMVEEYGDSVQFLAVLSGTHYEAMELNMFATKTKLKARIFRDYDYTIANLFDASVTPEFVVLDRQGKVYYQGLMDDRILTLGSYKQQWDKLYLKDALDAILKGNSPPISKTDPVGCALEY